MKGDTIEEAVNKVVNFWGKELFTGLGKFSVDDERINLFKIELSKEILSDIEYPIQIEIDYHPSKILINSTEKAGISSWYLKGGKKSSVIFWTHEIRVNNGDGAIKL